MKRFAFLAIIFLVLAVPTGIVLAAPGHDTVVESGETINNDVTLFGEDLDVTEGATINGDVVVFNGDARVAGTVNGDVVLFNGDLEAESSATITGDCVLMNGELDDKTESGISCSSIDEFDNLFATLGNLADEEGFGEFVTAQEDRHHERPSRAGRFFGNVAEAAVNSLVLGALAFAVASLLPNHLRQLESTLKQKPVVSGTVGVLTAVAVPSLMLLLSIISAILIIICIGILGFGVVIALALALVAAFLFGWIAVGYVVGQWLADPLRLTNRSLVTVTVVGTMVLTLGMGLLEAILPIMGLVSGLIAAMGLGAVALTQFGTRSYPAGNGPAAPADAEDIVIHEDPDKVSSVIDTMPPEDPSDLKNDG